ncbi:MAG TPA: glycosyltransferase [Candidatus Sulfotelmatobacter sp.]|nr:glycosyltransferase [Candidatus Sulfotelmatobacter sp.]
MESTRLIYMLFALYLATLVGLFLYGINCHILILAHRHGRRKFLPLPPLRPGDPHPAVTIQVPIYNEKYVARRAVEAVGRIRYPRDRLQIQVLDDSTDETVDIVRAAAALLRARGLHVEHLRRKTRTGYKAGALADGLERATGELIAIFDADFVPPEDFLERTIPGFRDPQVAVVQTRWGHLNRSYSALTGAQAIGIDGHFGVEQGARCWSGLFLNFNGTAGVWRASAIRDAGGWQHDCLTEDLDLSYRAQLRGWRILFLPNVVCPAELPVQIAAFKAQQRRWATGTIQTTLKLAPAIWKADLSPWVKLQAFLHTTHYLVHPLMLAVVLLSIPLLLLGAPFHPATNLLLVATLFALSTSGPTSLYVYGERQLGPGWASRLRYIPFMMLLGVGIAFSNTRAVWRGLTDRSLEFVRTPKYGIEARVGAWRGKGYGMRGAWEGVVELGLGLYALTGLWLYLHGTHYLILPFLVLYTLGFGWVGSLTIFQAFQATRPVSRPAFSFAAGRGARPAAAEPRQDRAA